MSTNLEHLAEVPEHLQKQLQTRLQAQRRQHSSFARHQEQVRQQLLLGIAWLVIGINLYGVWLFCSGQLFLGVSACLGADLGLFAVSLIQDSLHWPSYYLARLGHPRPSAEFIGQG